MFTGDPQTVMKKMEKYINNNFEKVELQIRVKKWKKDLTWRYYGKFFCKIKLIYTNQLNE